MQVSELPLTHRLTRFRLFLFPFQGYIVGGAQSHLLDMSFFLARFPLMSYLLEIYILGNPGMDNFIAEFEVVSVGSLSVGMAVFLK